MAIQQGTQIAQVIGHLGAAGAVKAMGTAFLSVINPVSLLTIGTIAGGAALFQSQGTEPVELDPVYRDLSDVEFMGLVRKAGPLTPAQFVEIMQTSTVDAVVMLRIMLSMNKAGIARDAELVGEGLQILTMGAWPVE